MTFNMRAAFLALQIAGFAALTTTQAQACEVGYYRFADSTGVAAWRARAGDYPTVDDHARPIEGLSVFEDLSQAQYMDMAATRNQELHKNRTFVLRVPCNTVDNTDELDFYEDAVDATNWTEPGGHLHGLIFSDGADTFDGLNQLQIDGQATPNFLQGQQVGIVRVPPANN